MSWDKIAADPGYQSLPAEKKLQVQENFYKSQIEPKVPAERRAAVKDSFLKSARPEAIPSSLEQYKKAAGQLIASATLAAKSSLETVAPLMKVAEGALPTHAEKVDELTNHAHQTAINMGIKPQDEQHELNPAITAMGPSAVKGLRAYQAVIDAVSPAVQRLKTFAAMDGKSLNEKIDTHLANEADRSDFEKASIAPNPSAAEAGPKISKMAAGVDRLTAQASAVMKRIISGPEDEPLSPAEAAANADQGGKAKRFVNATADLINAGLGSYTAGPMDPGVQGALGRVKKYVDSADFDELNDMANLSLLVLGAGEGVQMVAENAEAAKDLPRWAASAYIPDRLQKAIYQARGGTTALSVMPDEAVYNIWKDLPDEARNAMIRSNPQMKRIRTDIETGKFKTSVPVDSKVAAAQTIGAAVRGPEHSELSQTYPNLYAVANGAPIPKAASAEFGDTIGSLSRAVGNAPLLDMIGKGHFSGGFSRIALSKLDEAIQTAALQEAGAHPETMSRNKADLHTATSRPAETASVHHAEDEANRAAVVEREKNTKDVWAEAQKILKEHEDSKAPKPWEIENKRRVKEFEEQKAAHKATGAPFPEPPAKVGPEWAPPETREPESPRDVQEAVDAGVPPEQAIQQYVDAGEPGKDLAAIVPAVKGAGGEIILGQPGEHHQDIIDRIEDPKEKARAQENKDNEGPALGFMVDGKFRSREWVDKNFGFRHSEELNEMVGRAPEPPKAAEPATAPTPAPVAATAPPAAAPSRRPVMDYFKSHPISEKALKDAGFGSYIKVLQHADMTTKEGGQPLNAGIKNFLAQHKGAAPLSESSTINDLIDVIEREIFTPDPNPTEESAPIEAATPEWKKQKFEIQPKAGGAKMVAGYVSGAYGVHRGGPGWNVTHLPTGLRVSTEDTEAEAKAMAEALTEKVPDLNTLTDANSEAAAPILKKALSVRDNVHAGLNPGKGLKTSTSESTIGTDEPADKAGVGAKGTEPLGPESLLQIATERPQDISGVEESRKPEGAPGSSGEGPGEPVQDAERAPSEEGLPAGTGEVGGGAPGDGHLPAGAGRGELAREPGNLRITAETDLEPAGKVARFQANVDAIKTLRAIEADGRLATPAEQAILVKYVGWGQLKNAFETYYGEASWQARAKTLQNLLTPDEYESARQSTQNAHYTSREIIGSVYKAVEALGFRGGRVLEPSMGVGHFFGMLPDSMGGSRLVGVELDDLTARIAKQLYQSADIRAAGFQEVKLPNGYFDFIVSNVPFSDASPYDPEYNKFKYPLHDYFIVKSMDKLREGGVMSVITSRYSMDKLASSWRDKVYEKADLLGAVRLPETAFKGNADTQVVTDILFFRKRLAGEAPGDNTWLQSETKTRGDNEYSFNRYFSEHPEMVVGEVAFKRGQFSANDFTVKHEGEFVPALDAALSKLPSGVYSEANEPPKADALKQSDEAVGVKKGGHVVKGGKVFQRKGDELIEKSEADAPRVAAMLDLLDVMNKAIETQQGEAGEAAVQSGIKNLNVAYDKFVKKYGSLNDRSNKAALQDDPNLPRLLALENRKDKSWLKADIFSKQVIRGSKKVESMAAPADALNVILNETGKVDLQKISALTGKPIVEVKSSLKGLVYQNPEGGAWEIADVYLSGNVKQKLVSARAAAALKSHGDGDFRDNVAALEAVQPKDLEAHEVTVNLGAPWVPAEVIGAFVDHLTGVNRSVKTTYMPLIGRWSMEQGYGARGLSYSVGNNKTWGTARMSAIEIVKQILDGKQPTIYDGSKENRVVNQPETDAVRQKMEEIEDKFKSWIFEEKERRDPLLKLYNDTQNTHRVVKFNGAHLTLPGSNPGFNWRPHQKDAIFRSIVSRSNLLLAHEVGTGKTAVMSGIAMEARRIGIAKKPMIAALNANVGSIISDFRNIYPAAKLLTFEAGDLSPQTRGEFMSRIATGDWDAVIVTHPSFGKLPMSRDNQLDFYRKQIVDILGAMESAKMAEGKSSRMVKDLAKAKDRLEAKMEKLGDKIAKDDTITFEELGVDMLIVDESQEFKNLYFPTSIARGVKGLGSGSDAGRSFDMYMKTQYISNLNNGRGVVFATGTPITNSMSEVYTLQRYLASKELEAEGLNHFDAWARTYGKIVNSFELKPSGQGYRVVQRFAKFQNVSELMRRYLQFADVVRADVTNIVLPKVSGGKTDLVTVKASPIQKAFIESLVKRYENLKPGGDDNALLITTDGRKAALDMRLIDKSLPDDPGSKLNRAIGNIFKNWQDGKDKNLTQIVFCDLGVPGEDDRFNVYADIKNKLAVMGVPRNEVAFIHDAKDDDARGVLFEKVRQGQVRVLIGSRKKTGIGVNVQTLLKNSHSLDIPWRPDEIEQANGRIIRQGNTNEEVSLQQYATENTFDTYIFQLLEAKASSFAPIQRGEYNLREVEDLSGAALSFQESKAASSGNPMVVEKIKLAGEIRKLNNLQIAHSKSIVETQSDLAQLPAKIADSKARVSGFHADAELSKKHSGEFSMVVDGKTYSERKDAGEAILKFIQDNLTNYGDLEVGSYRGFRLVSPKEARGMILLGGKQYHSSSASDSALGTIASMESAINPTKLLSQAEETEKNVAAMEKRVTELEKTANAPFKFADKLKDLRDKEKKIDAELGRDQSDKGAGEAVEDEDSGPAGDIEPQARTIFDKEPKGRAPSGLADMGGEETPASLERLSAAAGKYLPMEMPELVRLARELIGSYPEIVKNMGEKRGAFYPVGQGKIKLRADIFEDVDQVAKTLAHELGHADDYLPDRTMARGNLIGRIMSFKKYLKDSFNGDAINNIPGMKETNKEMKQELVALSKFWRPWDRGDATPNYIKYRDSAKELYADAVSVFLVSPGTLEKMAPQFFHSFTDAMDRKPEFKAEWLNIQDLLHGVNDEFLAQRRADIREMGMKSEEILTRKQAEKNLQIQSIGERAAQVLTDRFYPILKAANELEANGVEIPDHLNPKHVFQQGDMVGNDIAIMDLAIDKILNPLMRDHQIGEIELHEYMFNNRILHDRSDMGNPLGMDPKAAQENLNYLKKTLGNDRYAALASAAEGIQDIFWLTMEEAHRLGVIGNEMWISRIIPNRGYYVTFAVLEHLEKTGYISPSIQAQVGTLKEIGNTFLNTRLKIAGMMQRNLDQKNKLSFKYTHELRYPGELKKTKIIHIGDGPGIERPEQGMEILRIYEDGRPVAYDVDPFIAEAFAKWKPAQMSLIHRVLNPVNHVLKLLYTTDNIGFVGFSSPLRYFQKTYKGLSGVPGATVGSLLAEYVRSLPASYRKAIGLPDDFVTMLLKEKALDVGMGDLEIAPSLNSYATKLKRYRLVQENESDHGLTRRVLSKVIMPLRQFGHAMQITADTVTGAWKIAAATIRIRAGEKGPEMAYHIRNYAGIPNPRVKGLAAQQVNDLYMFGNILQRHYVTAAQVLTNPKTRGGAALKTAAMDILPSIWQRMAAAGIFGLALKEFYKRVPEHTMRHYTVIPLGHVEGGKWKWKAAYMAIPHDDAGKIIHAMTHEVLKGMEERDPRQIAAIAGEIFAMGPSLTPAIQIPQAWAQEYTGGRYWDAYRQRTAIPDRVEKIGGLLKLEKMVQWTMNETGITNFAAYDPATKTTTENFIQATPLLNRLVQISDYGMEEQFRKDIADTPDAAELYALNEKYRNQEHILTPEENRRRLVLMHEAKRYRFGVKRGAAQEQTSKRDLQRAMRERINP